MYRHAQVWTRSKLELAPDESPDLWLGNTAGSQAHPRHQRIKALGDGIAGNTFRQIADKQELPWLTLLADCERMYAGGAGTRQPLGGSKAAHVELQRYQGGATTISITGMLWPPPHRYVLHPTPLTREHLAPLPLQTAPKRFSKLLLPQ